MRFVRHTALLIGLTLLASQTARANNIFVQEDVGYTDLPTWQSAVTEIGVDTFDLGNSPNIAPTVGTVYNTNAGYRDGLYIDFVGSFNFPGNGVYNLEAVGPSLSQYYAFGSGNSLFSGPASTGSSPYLQATWPTLPNITAISLDVMTYGNIVPVTITASDGTTVIVNTAVLQESFFGFTFTTPVSWLEVSVPGSPTNTHVLLDNFAIGTADDDVAAPEPGTFALIGLGLVFLACLRKRRPA